MDKKSFPGRLSDKDRQQRKAAREKRKQQRKKDLEEVLGLVRGLVGARRDFNNAIGPAARLAIVRRGLVTFVACALLGVGIGSVQWESAEKDKISYPDAFKRAYNFNKPAINDIHTTVAMVFLIISADIAFLQVYEDQKRARRLLEKLLEAIDVYDNCDEDCHRTDAITYSLFREIERQNEHIKRLNIDYINSVQGAIINKYVSENPIMFDRVLSYTGWRPMNQVYAMTVIETHLENHPEDYKKLLETYDETSIPWSLVLKYGEKRR